MLTEKKVKFSRTDCGEAIIYVIEFTNNRCTVSALGYFLPMNGKAPETAKSRKMDKVVDLFNSSPVFHFFLIKPHFRPFSVTGAR